MFIQTQLELQSFGHLVIFTNRHSSELAEQSSLFILKHTFFVLIENFHLFTETKAMQVSVIRVDTMAKDDTWLADAKSTVTGCEAVQSKKKILWKCLFFLLTLLNYSKKKFYLKAWCKIPEITVKPLRSLLLNWLASTVNLGFIYTAIHSIKLFGDIFTEIVTESEILDSFSMEEHLFSLHPSLAAPDDGSL